MLQLRGRVTKSWALRLSISASALAIASASASAQTVQLDGIVLTFSKMAESAIEALSGSSAIDKDQLDQQFQPDSVSQFINTIPGVSSTQSGASDPAQSINIRGLQDFWPGQRAGRRRTSELCAQRTRRERSILF
jgi:Outer membrane cobalamin receptor protein